MSKIFYEKGKPIPKSLGEVADHLKEVTLLRLEMKKEVDLVEAREKELRNHLVENLSDKDTGVSGRKYHAQVKKSVKPIVDDWEDVYNYIVENDAFHLLGKSLSVKAVNELWEAGVKIPGVSKMHAKTLSLTKVK